MSILQANGAGLGGAGAPGGALAGGGILGSHAINQSLRFNDDDSAYLSRTPASASNQRTWTWSAWVKRGNVNLGNRTTLFSGRTTGTSNLFGFFNPASGAAADTFGAYLSADGDDRFQTTRVFRDPNAWYHFVVVLDTTQGSNDDRFKLYVNGIQETTWTRFDTITQNSQKGFNEAISHSIGAEGTARFFDGYMAEVNFIDGTALYPTSFGETIGGVWVPKAYSGSYGTNGFYLPFDDSSAIGDDESGNTNDWTANNLAASDVVPDSPTNNFATMNELQVQGPSNTTPYALSEGSLKMTSTANAYAQMSGAMGVQSGKWYTETYINSAGYPSWYIGWIARDRLTTFTGGNDFDGVTTGLGYFTGSNVYILDFGDANNASTTVAVSGLWSGARAPTTGDIIGCAVDFDNRKIWWSINGEYVDVGSGAGDPANGTNPTSTYTASDVADDAYKFAWQVGYASTTKTINFGQDSTFAGATTAGGNADGNGIGDFKYAPPSGFLALCTSNLPDITIGPGQTNQADDFFEPILYTGNGGTQHIGSGGVQHPQNTTIIANSLKFEDGDQPALSKNDFGTQTNTKKMTISVWVKRANLGIRSTIIFAKSGSSAFLNFDTNDKIVWNAYNTGYTSFTSDIEFKDTSTWYHIVAQADSQDQTGANIHKVYVNGSQITGTTSGTFVPDDTATKLIANGVTTYIGDDTDGAYHFDGYLAEMNVIDGSIVDPEEFGQVGSNGYWIPKTISGLTYGTNGFRLTFQNSSYLGYDYQTSNRSTTNDFSVSNLVATDQVIDSPTQNFSTMDPNRYSGIGTFSEGNLTVATTTNNRSTYGTIAVPLSGKWYYEVRVDSYASGGGAHFGWGTDVSKGGNEASSSEGIQFSTYNERVLLNGTGQSGGYGSTGTDVASNGDVYSVLLDVDNGLFYYAKNGTYFNSANPSNSTGGLDVSNVLRAATTEVRPNLARGGSYNETYTFNFGQDPSFNGGETAPGTDKTDANGVGKFLYDVPTGFLALMDDNIPQEGVESPDFVWIKERNNNSKSHYLFDTVRGATKNLHTDSTAAEATDTDSLLSFDYQGFTVGSNGDVNGSADTYVAWNWKAGGIAPTKTYTVKVVSDSGNKYRFDDFGTSAVTLELQEGGTYTFDQSDSSNSGHPLRFSTTSNGTHGGGSEYTTGVTTTGTPGTTGAKTVITVAHGAPILYYYCTQHSGMGGQANTNTTHGSSNFDGSIQSVVSANTDAGFSICTYTGTSTVSESFGHGLNQAPELVITKARNTTDAWRVHGSILGTDKFLALSGTNAVATDSSNGGFPDNTDTLVNLGYESTNGTNYVAYCFHSVPGYSAVGSYIGNNSTDGPFSFTGFRPAWLMLKRSDSAADWLIYDNKRDTFNQMQFPLFPRSPDDEYTSNLLHVDFLSNGFKIRNATYGETNASGGNYIYLAFAEQPFKFANAR